MSRNFCVRERGHFDRFWNEPMGDRDPLALFVVIGMALALILAVALFVV
jgi:hypothetical protein